MEIKNGFTVSGDLLRVGFPVIHGHFAAATLCCFRLKFAGCEGKQIRANRICFFKSMRYLLACQGFILELTIGDGFPI